MYYVAESGRWAARVSVRAGASVVLNAESDSQELRIFGRNDERGLTRRERRDVVVDRAVVTDGKVARGGSGDETSDRDHFETTGR